MTDQDKKTQQGEDTDRDPTIRDLDPSPKESEQIKGGLSPQKIRSAIDVES